MGKLIECFSDEQKKCVALFWHERRKKWVRKTVRKCLYSITSSSNLIVSSFDMLMLTTEIIGILALSDEGERFSSMKEESTVDKNILTSKLSKNAFRLSHFFYQSDLSI